jgi:hypothetical protein
MRSWILPTLLGGVVIALVASTRRRTPMAPAPSVTLSPTTPAAAVPPPDVTPPPMPLTDAEVLTSHQALLARIQNDLRSVDPASLDLLYRLLAERGFRQQAVEARTWAGCVRDALADLDYFPRACGPFPYTPGQSPIILAKDPVTAHVDLLRERYRTWTARDFYAADIPYQDILETALRNAGLLAEADALRKRRDELFSLRARNAILAAPTTPPDGLAALDAIANDLSQSGYLSEATQVRNAVTLRRRELSAFTCALTTGCSAFRSPDRTSAVDARLPMGARVTLLTNGDPPVGGAAANDDFVLASFEAAPGAPTTGWILARVLARAV